MPGNNTRKFQRTQAKALNAALKAAEPKPTLDMKDIQRLFMDSSGGSYAKGRVIGPRKKIYGDRTTDRPSTIHRLNDNEIYNVNICDPASGVTRLAVIDLDNHEEDRLKAIARRGKIAHDLEVITKRLTEEERLKPIVVVSGGGEGYQILLRWTDPQPIDAVASMLQAVAPEHERAPTLSTLNTETGKAIDIPGQRRSRLKSEVSQWAASPPIRYQWIRSAEQRKALVESYNRPDADPELVKECLKRIPRPDNRSERFGIAAAAYRAGGQTQEITDALIEWWDPWNNLTDKKGRQVGEGSKEWREFVNRITNVDISKPGAGMGSLVLKAREADPSFAPRRQEPEAPKIELRRLGDIPIGELFAEPIVSGLLYAGQPSMIFGPSNGGKSVFAVALSCSVAAGQSILGRRTTRSPVAYFALEAPDSIIKRAHVWCDRHPKAREAVLKNLLICQSGLRLASTKDKASPHLKEVIRMIKESGARLAIFDTFARVMVGMDENSAADSGVVMEAFQEIVRETGACVVFIHHTGKDLDIGFRGNTAIGAAASVHIYVVDGIYGEEKKKAHVVRLTHAKDDQASEIGYFRTESAMFSGAPAEFIDEQKLPVLVPMVEPPEGFKERERGAVTAQDAENKKRSRRGKVSVADQVKEALFDHGMKGLSLADLFRALNVKTREEKSPIHTALNRLKTRGEVEDVPDTDRLRLAGPDAAM